MRTPFLASCLLAAALFAQGQTASTSASARPPITGISHISVYSADLGKSEAFYTHNLGAFKAADPENSQGVRYYFSPTQFVEVLPLPQGYTSINRLDHVAFVTSNVEAMRAYLGAHGIAVPAAVQSGSDGSRWFDVKDPEDNKVEFLQVPSTLPQVPADIYRACTV
jgi:catechol 2,3-dioxygenase-like lactoylglutathione lyase family enzyme